MRILYSPLRSDKKIIYSFSGEIVTATFNEATDIFDFTTLPDGVADSVESDLETNPILKAEKIEGILHLTLLNFIGADATEAERFPEWQEV